MSAACQFLHERLVKLPRLRAGFDPRTLPGNGLYFLFENEEAAHGGERIVRVGTHTGENNLPKRLNEHLYTPNKDRSIFRKHVGRCILSQRNDPFLEAWEIDLTTKKAREKSGHLVDKQRWAEVEKEVSRYINENFSFVVLKITEKESRMRAEMDLLGSVAQCTECRASGHWLGLHHPNRAIRESGLWNIRGLDSAPISFDEAAALL
jgi:hypothetical protein